MVRWRLAINAERVHQVISRFAANTVRALSLIVAVAAALHGCSEPVVGPTPANRPPTVWLSAAPPQGAVTDYRLHLFWGGWDPDGEISHYEYLITDNESGVFNPADTVPVNGESPWNPVFSHDSIFGFSADVPEDSTDFGTIDPGDGGRDPNGLESEEFQRSHTFFIRAVDMFGLRSPAPAQRSFTSRTLSPTVDVRLPPPRGLEPTRLPPIATYRWVGNDFVGDETEQQEPDEVRWILVPTKLHGGSWEQTEHYIRTRPHAPEWSEWHDYQARDGSGTSWTTPPMDLGEYVFAVQVKDEAGAVTPVFDLKRNLRRVIVSDLSTGPKVSLTNEFIGTLVWSSAVPLISSIQLPKNVPMCFEFRADASHYGAKIAGYRYGWNVLDLNDPDQWEITLTPMIGTVVKVPCRKFFAGTNTFTLEVVDNSGFRTRIQVRIEIIEFTMERPLLLVDDWREGTTTNWEVTKGALPSDGEHDAFWRTVLEDVEGFLPQRDVFEVRPGQSEVPITVLARYANVIWVATASHSGPSSSVVARMTRFRDPDPDSQTSGGRVLLNLPAIYMAAGGHILLAGQEFMTMAINRDVMPGPHFPIIFRYELNGDQDGQYQPPDNDVGTRGIGERSFAYNDCCLNVLDIAYIANANAVRKFISTSPNGGCPVSGIRDHNGRSDGLRAALPLDVTTGAGFPRLELRDKAAGPGRFYNETKLGLNCDIYNPVYFEAQTSCAGVIEYTPPRTCFEKIYGLECLNTSSAIFGAAIAFWTSRWADRVADVGGVAARSAVWGFSPVYFKPQQVKEAVGVIVHDEWQVPRVE